MKGGRISMQFQGEFETLKMIEQGGKVNCYTEYAEGELLMSLVRRKEVIAKSQLWKWLNEICVQVNAYHRCYHRAYQYINPYTILVCKDQSIKLLDLESRENENILIYLQKNIIRESFSRSGNLKKSRIYTDFYSFGKTLQFILSKGNIFPQVNFLESHQLSKIIKKSLEELSENTFQNFKEIQKQLPKIKEIQMQKSLK